MSSLTIFLWFDVYITDGGPTLLMQELFTYITLKHYLSYICLVGIPLGFSVFVVVVVEGDGDDNVFYIFLFPFSCLINPEKEILLDSPKVEVPRNQTFMFITM